MNVRAAVADVALSLALVVIGVVALILIANAFWPLWP
jgi:hypothetical protein